MQNTGPELSWGQYRLAIRTLSRKRYPVLDVGIGDASWLVKMQQQGHPVSGIEESRSDTPLEGVHYGSPAASIPFPVHHFRAALLRGTRTFFGECSPMEVTIGLANILSCLQPRGLLIIPGTGESAQWEQRLQAFPVSISTRLLQNSLLARCSGGLFSGGLHPLEVVQFRVDRRPISRLEWHRLAREAIMKTQGPAAA